MPSDPFFKLSLKASLAFQIFDLSYLCPEAFFSMDSTPESFGRSQLFIVILLGNLPEKSGPAMTTPYLHQRKLKSLISKKTHIL